MNVRLETDRLLLRAFTLSDVAAAYEMDRDPEVCRYTGERAAASVEQMRELILHNIIGDYEKYGFGRFAVEEKSTGDFVGFAGLKYLPEMDEVDIGYRFLPRCWGRGLATEAGAAVLEFGWTKLDLERIIGLVLAENLASIRVLKKLGLRFEKMIAEAGGVEVQCFAIDRGHGGAVGISRSH